jgi:hypothetical protein
LKFSKYEKYNPTTREAKKDMARYKVSINEAEGPLFKDALTNSNISLVSLDIVFSLKPKN